MAEQTNINAAAEAVILRRLGADVWLTPPTVLACANLSAVRQMVEAIDGPDGDAVCILAPTENGFRRFNVFPGSEDLAGEVHEAMTVAGPTGAMVVTNVLAPAGYGAPCTAEVKRLRWLPVSFAMRPDEDVAAVAARISNGGLMRMVRSEVLNPLVMHDTIRDRFCILVPADIPLLDEGDRAAATDLMWRLAHCLGGDPLNDPLPGVVPLAGSIGVNAAGTVYGQVLAFPFNPNGPQPGRLAGSSLVELEQFVTRLEALGGPAIAL